MIHENANARKNGRALVREEQTGHQCRGFGHPLDSAGGDTRFVDEEPRTRAGAKKGRRVADEKKEKVEEPRIGNRCLRLST